MAVSRWSFAAAAALLAPLGFFSPMIGSPLLVGGGLLLAWQHARARRWPAADPRPFLCLAALLAWGLASALWAADPARAAGKAVELALLLLLVWLWFGAAAARPAPFGRYLGIGVGIAILLMLGEGLSGATVHRLIVEHTRGTAEDMPIEILNRPLTILVLALWPALAWLAKEKRWTWVAAFVVAALAAAFATKAGAAKLALVLGLVAAGLAYLAPRIVTAAVGVATTALFLLAPLIAGVITAPATVATVLPSLPPSALHRLYMWEFVAQRIAERPFFGWGLEASRNLPGAKELYLGIAELMSLHPHNAALQIWVELGLVGALLAAAFFAYVYFSQPRRNVERRQTAAAIGFLVTTLTIASLSFGLWQTWWLATIALTGAFLVALG